MSTRHRIILGVMIFFLIYAVACGTDITIIGMIAFAFLATFIKISRYL